MEDEVPSRAQKPTPALVVGTHTVIAMVTVDEDELAGSRRRICRPRIPDYEPDPLLQSESNQGRSEQVIELRARKSVARRKIVRVKDAARKRRGKEKRAATLVPAYFRHRS